MTTTTIWLIIGFVALAVCVAALICLLVLFVRERKQVDDTDDTDDTDDDTDDQLWGDLFDPTDDTDGQPDDDTDDTDDDTDGQPDDDDNDQPDGDPVDPPADPADPALSEDDIRRIAREEQDKAEKAKKTAERKNAAWQAALAAKDRYEECASMLRAVNAEVERLEADVTFAELKAKKENRRALFARLNAYDGRVFAESEQKLYAPMKSGEGLDEAELNRQASQGTLAQTLGFYQAADDEVDALINPDEKLYKQLLDARKRLEADLEVRKAAYDEALKAYHQFD